MPIDSATCLIKEATTLSTAPSFSWSVCFICRMKKKSQFATSGEERTTRKHQLNLCLRDTFYRFMKNKTIIWCICFSLTPICACLLGEHFFTLASSLHLCTRPCLRSRTDEHTRRRQQPVRHPGEPVTPADMLKVKAVIRVRR